MAYAFPSMEKGTPAGNAAETCAMLHLMCYSEERDVIEHFAIDCFNDVTGMDGSCLSLYDVQSKAGNNINPAKIGEDLATLFENAVSEFSQYFVTFTLFVGGVSSSVLETPELTEFGYHDMKPKAQESVRAHLISEVKEGHKGRFATYVTDENIDNFLCKVRFVVSKAEPAEYIRVLAHTSSALMPGDRELMNIFTQIRDKQSALKNRGAIVGESINRPDEVTNYGRIIKWREIKLLIIERLLDRRFYKDKAPAEFMEYLETLPPEEDIKDVAEDCRNEMLMQYFDKSDSDAFWRLFDEIVTVVEAGPDASIIDVYRSIDVKTLKACRHMEPRSKLYFIATIKDGLSHVED